MNSILGRRRFLPNVGLSSSLCIWMNVSLVSVLVLSGCSRSLMQTYGEGLSQLRPGMTPDQARALVPIGSDATAFRQIGDTTVTAYELRHRSRRAVAREPLPSESQQTQQVTRVEVQERVWIYFAERSVESTEGEEVAGVDAGLSLVMWGLPSEWPDEEAVRRVRGVRLSVEDSSD